MNSIFFSILAVLTCFDNLLKAEKLLQVKTEVNLKKSPGNSKLPAAPNAVKCGGTGSHSELRILGCKVSNGMCSVPSDEKLQIEIDFPATDDARSLNFKIELSVEQTSLGVVFDEPISNSAVSKGGKYTITVTTALSSAFRGQKVKCKYQVLGEDGSLKMCVEGEVIVA